MKILNVLGIAKNTKTVIKTTKKSNFGAQNIVSTPLRHRFSPLSVKLKICFCNRLSEFLLGLLHVFHVLGDLVLEVLLGLGLRLDLVEN